MRLTLSLLLLAAVAGPTAAQQTAPRPDSARADTTRRPTRVAPVVIAATRSERRIEDEPLRVEVLEREEVEEKLLMTPGDISMMLNETTGLRVQATSPGLGGANVRVQGLRGRYTQILVDGLPLHGAQTGGLGLLQIPPMDLGSVEIIKGASSALYGGSALGGVINLVSRRPDEEPINDLLLNRTSLGGSDAVMFRGAELSERWGYTLLAGAHAQDRVDRDDDGWSDVARYERGVVRPRLYWRSARGHSAMLTLGGTLEHRVGGTEPGALAPDGFPFREALRTERLDAGLTARWLVGPTIVAARGTLASQRHAHRFGAALERDAHRTAFAEVSATGAGLNGIWVLGAALQAERYAADDVSGFDYSFTTPGLFAQHTVDVGRVALSASGRIDAHSEYGNQVSPRLSALVRLREGWSVRASLGEGYFAPTPFTEEVEVVGLSALDPLPALRAERGRSGSIDLAGELGEVELHASVFASELSHAVATRESAGDPLRLALVNLNGRTRTHGAELALRSHAEPFHWSVSYTWLNATEPDAISGLRRDVPLTPTHSLGALIAYEVEDVGRAGLEVYRTGVQSLADDPFRTRSEAYVHIGFLVERHIGAARVFVNAENLLDYRQTRASSLVRPTQGPGGRWTTDVWGPLDGRVVNLGLRF
jgi:outer membrane receptor for ferrienterochelin and colicins